MVTLETCSLFKQSSPSELDSLRRGVQERTYSAGQIVFKEGDAGDGLYIVKKGLVEISGLVGPNKRCVFSKLGAGELFGEMAVVEDQPRSATAVALEPATLFFFGRAEMLQMVRSSPSLALALLREISGRLREFNRQYLNEVLQAERLTVVGRFARSIVHDLKNPLHLISLTSELLDLQQTTPEGHTRTAQIGEQVTRINDLIGEILDFTQGPQSRFVLMPMAYGPFLHDVAAKLRVDAELQQVRIELSDPVPDAAVLMDPKRLRRVFHNLIHNAIEAMPSGGTVYIRCDMRSNEIVTEIEDTGPGIAPEIRDTLFEPFATHGKVHGTGLGLSISRRVMEDHRGWITARSEPGRGAIFRLGLPRAAAQA